MAASATFGNAILQLILNNVADSAGLTGAGTATELYVSLHTASPAGGTQATNEAAYTGYARVAVARTTAGWAVSGTSYANAAAVTFPQATGGSEAETWFAIGTAATGAGEIVFYGAINASLAVSDGIQPQFSTGELSGSAS